MLQNVILILILAAILGGAGRYVYKAKKSGAKCIGCSAGEGGCHCQPSKGSAGCGCGCCGGEEN